MSLQMGIHNRRKFLERSMWGFGSAFLLPSLLQSCMSDHTLPPPLGGDDNPLPTIGDYQIDWNDAAKTALTTGLGMIPEAGEILSALVDIFWPSSGTDVWGQIKDQVEALIDQKIADSVYQQVSEDLLGLNNAMTLYLNEVKSYNESLQTNPNADPTSVREQWVSTRTVFVNNLPHFQSNGYQLLLLPLFAQFGNLYLSLMRDGVAFGQSWGRSAADHQQDIADLNKDMLTFYQYTYDTYNTAKINLANKTKVNNNLCEPFRTVNTYDRQMILTVMDFANNWAYFDVTQYPQGVPAEILFLDREIYSDPYGSCDNSGPIVLPAVKPTQFPTNITVWGFDRIDAVQLTYPTGSGPNGVTTTPRMGDQPNGTFGGQNYAPHGGSFNLSPNNPIVGAYTTYGLFQNNNGTFGPLVAQLAFLYQDWTQTNVMGGTAGSVPGWIYNSGWVAYPTEALSSIHINGVNNVLKTADCIVYGFKFLPSPAVTLKALQTLYIASPKERTVAELTKKLRSAAVPANLITEELRSARVAYWAALKARAKALK